MRIVFAGTPDLALPGLSALQANGHEIVGVITREDAPLGRKRVMTPSPVASFAADNDIPVLKANRLDESADDWVRSLSPDIGVIIAYGGLLKTQMLNIPRLGWINLHFSDLPKWRGAAPVQRALMAGETKLSATVFRLVEALDAGRILTGVEHEFAFGVTAGEALETLSQLGSQALIDAAEILREDPQAGKEQEGESSYAHKLERADGKLDFTRTAKDVIAQWAGVTPEPGAFAEVDGQSIKILAAKMSDPQPEEALQPGETVFAKKTVLVGTQESAIELLRVQPAGKKAMNAADWLRGKNGQALLK